MAEGKLSRDRSLHAISLNPHTSHAVQEGGSPPPAKRLKRPVEHPPGWTPLGESKELRAPQAPRSTARPRRPQTDTLLLRQVGRPCAATAAPSLSHLANRRALQATIIVLWGTQEGAWCRGLEHTLVRVFLQPLASVFVACRVMQVACGNTSELPRRQSADDTGEAAAAAAAHHSGRPQREASRFSYLQLLRQEQQQQQKQQGHNSLHGTPHVSAHKGSRSYNRRGSHASRESDADGEEETEEQPHEDERGVGLERAVAGAGETTGRSGRQRRRTRRYGESEEEGSGLSDVGEERAARQRRPAKPRASHAGRTEGEEDEGEQAPGAEGAEEGAGAQQHQKRRQQQQQPRRERGETPSGEVKEESPPAEQPASDAGGQLPLRRRRRKPVWQQPEANGEAPVRTGSQVGVQLLVLLGPLSRMYFTHFTSGSSCNSTLKPLAERHITPCSAMKPGWQCLISNVADMPFLVTHSASGRRQKRWRRHVSVCWPWPPRRQPPHSLSRRPSRRPASQPPSRSPSCNTC